ncbi:alkaline phosphatase family protein [Sphingomonas sp. DG1-23]|uniref:alkaline phosphatase family protein n=1 Tax=Sphingomonas sp. DG1-23 TaxID=3068316 RepID=UPI00273F20D6|nr:alkaline phosphatase family protein [Sphingomonas sp. DG1-23]MDP5278668.1 alkaline phosphatase family protein [Sphingomonas sp. DG1-23]
MNALKLCFIGIDGAPFPLIMEMAQSGQLPNITKLCERGSVGPLASTIPPHTAPGWTSMFTGVSPGSHGIFQFWKLQSNSYRHDIAGSADWCYEPIWQTLGKAGIACGVFNVPMTHPPEPLPDGWMVSWPLAPTLHYTAPPSLLQELRDAGHRPNTDFMMMWAGLEEYPAAALAGIGERLEMTRYLLGRHPVDALFLVLTEFDRIAHYHTTPAGFGEPARAALREMDRAIATLIAECPDDCTIIFASDHGFGPCLGDVSINALLREAGLIHQTRPLASERLERGLDGIAREDHAIGWSWSEDAQGSVVDWKRTHAYMPVPGCYGINLNRKGRQREGVIESADIPHVERDLSDLLRTVRDPRGRPIFDLIPARDVYSGLQAGAATDYLLIPSDWGWMASCALEGAVMAAPQQPGVHRREGFAMVRSPFTRTEIGGAAQITAVYSTILAALGVPPAFETECEPLCGIPPAGRPSESRQTFAARATSDIAYQALAERHLHALGYL